ncbi:MAG: hypothetical protein ACFE8L_02845 [Candidatus Hodarchaeota archaeon]
MQNPENLAQEALNLLEIAQKLEEERKIKKAIVNYEKAGELLKQSGYLTHRIQDIYDRIQELNNYLKQDKLYQYTQAQTQIGQIQDQAFALLDGAKKLESDGYFEDAIKQYISTIDLLAQAGWSNIQLDNLNEKIKILANKLEQEKIILQQKELITSQQVGQEQSDLQPQITGMFGEKATPEKIERIETYKAMKKREEEIQNEAFILIDKAKMLEQKKKLDKAIINYERAVELLNSIGWIDQTSNIQAIIEKLKTDRENILYFQAQQKQASEALKSKVELKKPTLKSEAELKEKKMKEFEEKKIREEEIQTKAFNLIDIGKMFERDKNYEKANQMFNQAIEMLKSIEWDAYIQPIINLINDVKEKQKREQKSDQLKEKREDQLMKLQESISLKQQEQLLQSTHDLESRRRELEEKRKETEKKENEFFTILERADKILQEEKDFDKAISEYQHALETLKEMGGGWEHYRSTIRTTITNVRKIRESQLKKQQEEQRGIKERKEKELEFQKTITEQIDRERTRLKQKEIELKERDAEVKYREQRKSVAFKYMDDAHDFITRGDFENAINAYQNAGKIFAEIQWTDEIPLIEKSISEIEQIRRTHLDLKQKKFQEAIERHKIEEEFQRQIAKQLQIEREKLKKKEIALRKHEEELKEQEDKRKAGFVLLGEAQDHVKQGDFDKAIEILQYATNFFADAQWQNEIRLIQNSIIEIENKKRESEINKQIELQTTLEREKQEKDFQNTITKMMKTQRDKLKQREIILREREEELAHREKKKEEAFYLLDKAQNVVSQGNLEYAIEIYYDAANIFAEIQWHDEIPIIQKAIQSIKNKIRENEILKQKEMQKSIEKEMVNRAFVEKIKRLRERELAKEMEKAEIIEQQKEIASKHSKKQQSTFKLISDTDVLLHVEDFDAAIENYKKAIGTLTEIGWTPGYLKLLEETVQTINERKKEREREKQLEQELLIKRQKEEQDFQSKISASIQKDKERIRKKEFEIQKREELIEKIENRKEEAFKLMDNAENLLLQNKYLQSIEQYRQAELILNEIGFSTRAIREMIQKIKENKREDDLAKQKEFETNIRKEQEDIIFQREISDKLKNEEEKMKIKQKRLKDQEEFKLIAEQRKKKAFDLLENAQNYIQEGEFDEAIELYKKAEKIFIEIKWDEEVSLIRNSIFEIETKKRESELEKQRELQMTLEREKQQKEFQDQISMMMRTQRDKLKQKEIALREREQELAHREKRKVEAFNLLDKAQRQLSQGNLGETIELYHQVASIFAQIQWNEEIPVIQRAIQDIENKRKEKDVIRQKTLQMEIEKEKADYEFLEKIKSRREFERIKALEQQELLEKQRIISTHNLTKQKNAFKLIEEGDLLLAQKEFNKSIDNYQKAIESLKELGWTDEYLRVLQETIQTIKNRKLETEKNKQLERTMMIKIQEEEEQFQKKIAENLQREREKIQAKKIEIKKLEDLKQYMEIRKKEAFEIMDRGEKLLNQGNYEQSIENYRQAELVLNEIGFPTTVVKEMIQKIQNILKSEISRKEKEFEGQLKKEREEFLFLQDINERLKIKEKKRKIREEQILKQRELYAYKEKRKEDAFNLLEEAEIFMKNGQYDNALEYYDNAEVILNEIQFPTESIREMKYKVQEKKKEYQLEKQRELENEIQRKREEREFQRQIANDINSERERLKSKQIQILEIEERKRILEQRKQQAFNILDEAENATQRLDYYSALENYRKASLLLNELQFPTESIENMISRVTELKKQNEQEEALKYKRQLERLEEERQLKVIIEERQRQEKEKKIAHQIALQERERVIQEQMNQREAAYSLLEKAQIHLKRLSPDYDSAIALYTQARDFLAENIGWQPEITNLNDLINDLQLEKADFIERKRLEEQARLQRQKEYILFQEEVRRRRIEQEKLKQEQQRQYRELYLKREQVDRLRDEGLNLIDEGKKWAAYHDFEQSYENFNLAIEKFREIGWEEEVKYIQNEIKNTKILEDRVKKEDLRIQTIYEQLEKQKSLEEYQRKQKESELQQTITEVGDLAGDIISLIEDRRKKQRIEAEEQKVQLKKEAQDFSKKMGGLIRLKEDLIAELAKKEDEKRKKVEEIKSAKEREKVDDIKKMLKDVAKKKKK